VTSDMADIFTIERYLNGKARNIKVPDDTIDSIIIDAGCIGADKDTPLSELSQRERELCLAWLYVWIAGSPTQSGGWSEESADWKSSENGERMSAGVLKQYLAMANEIFDKYDLPAVGSESWGFVGHGIHNPRRYR